MRIVDFKQTYLGWMLPLLYSDLNSQKIICIQRYLFFFGGNELSYSRSCSQ